MFSNLKRKVIMVSLFGFFIVLGVFVPFQEKQTDAIIGLPFGGKITTSIPCTCSPGMLITVTGPSPGIFVLMPVAKVYSYGQVYRSGPSILGSYSGVGVCLMAGIPCIPMPNEGTITIAGTSL